jgi:stage II sporulation protein R
MVSLHGARRWGLLLLLLGLAGLLLWGCGTERAQSALADKVIRLHVIANSDSNGDQALKLLVRDRILAELSPQLLGESDAETASRQISSLIPALCAAGEDEVRQNGYTYPVTAALEQCWFPTRDYGSFSLPAGQYTALRVVIGQGAGQNWWCVVFPPLCMNLVTETSELAAAAGLSDDEISLITGDSEGYVFRFKSIELWEAFREKYLNRD